jgi:hypothetical protein
VKRDTSQWNEPDGLSDDEYHDLELLHMASAQHEAETANALEDASIKRVAEEIRARVWARKRRAHSRRKR